jgi:serine/threonine protein kinase
VGKTDEHLYYVMDPADDISGVAASAEEDYRPATLKSRLESGPLSAEECVKFAGQLLAGLASLHEVGMVHRDVKPANCLFVEGELKLADFGLLTETGPHVSRVGTEKYMPPDGRMDTRADVYAAGLVIYEMLTGLPADRFPHLGRRANELAECPKLRSLLRTMLRAGQSDPELRFRDASPMLTELNNDAEPPASAKRTFSRRLVVSLVGGVVVVGLLIAAWQAWPPAGGVPGEASRVHVNFVTEKPFFDAHILLDGELQKKPDGAPYMTPCTIPDLPSRSHEVSFRLDGQEDLDAGRIDFAETRHIVGHWVAER